MLTAIKELYSRYRERRLLREFELLDRSGRGGGGMVALVRGIGPTNVVSPPSANAPYWVVKTVRSTQTHRIQTHEILDVCGGREFAGYD